MSDSQITGADSLTQSGVQYRLMRVLHCAIAIGMGHWDGSRINRDDKQQKIKTTKLEHHGNGRRGKVGCKVNTFDKIFHFQFQVFKRRLIFQQFHWGYHGHVEQ